MSDQKRFDMILGKQRARARLREFIGNNLFSYKNARVLCLPGENGREIEHVYRKLGFRDENIVGVESNAKAVRGVRTHYPNIDVREGDLFDVVQEIVVSPTEAPFDVVSLDFCGNFSEERLAVLRFLQAAGKLSRRCVIATNFFAGREHVHNQNDMRLHYAMHARSLISSAELAPFLHRAEEESDKLLAKADATSLGEVRDSAPRVAVVNELTHYGPHINLSRWYELIVSKPEADAYMKKRGVRRDTRQRLLPYFDNKSAAELFSQNPFLVVPIITSMKVDEIYAVLEPLIRTRPGRWRIPDSDDPHAVALAFAQKAVSAFCDDFGEAHVMVEHELYSYINDAAHKMISDYFVFEQHKEALKKLPKALAPDSCGGLYLDPDPDTFSPPIRYVDYIFDIHARYHAIPQLWVQKTGSRVPLGGGALPIDEGTMKDKIVKALKNGRTDEEVMAKFPVTIGTIRALRANITMGRT